MLRVPQNNEMEATPGPAFTGDCHKAYPVGSSHTALPCQGVDCGTYPSTVLTAELLRRAVPPII